MYREVWNSWRDVLERRLYSLQNHAQQLTHLPLNTSQCQEAWHRWSVMLLPPSSLFQSNEWTLPIEGVKLNFPQILKAEGDFLQGLTISPRVSSFSSNKTVSTTVHHGKSLIPRLRHLDWCVIAPECTRKDGRYRRRYYWIGDGRVKPSRIQSQFKSPPSKLAGSPSLLIHGPR